MSKSNKKTRNDRAREGRRGEQEHKEKASEQIANERANTKTTIQKKRQTTIQPPDTSNNKKIKTRRRHEFEPFDKIPKQTKNKNKQNSLVICVFLLIILTAPQLQRDSYKKKTKKWNSRKWPLNIPI